jgi:hypothetical protein
MQLCTACYFQFVRAAVAGSFRTVNQLQSTSQPLKRPGETVSITACVVAAGTLCIQHPVTKSHNAPVVSFLLLPTNASAAAAGGASNSMAQAQAQSQSMEGERHCAPYLTLQQQQTKHMHIVDMLCLSSSSRRPQVLWHAPAAAAASPTDLYFCLLFLAARWSSQSVGLVNLQDAHCSTGGGTTALAKQCCTL